MRCLTLLLLGAILFTAGCGSCVGRGVALYQERSYIEAAEAFERTQSRLSTMETADRARYGLYRGLTFIALGDLRRGEQWLDYAEAQQQARPNLLGQDERAMLARGRVDLNQQLQAILPKPDPQWTQSVAATSAPGSETSQQ